MGNLQSEQASFLLQTILPVMKIEHRTTKSVIEAIPVDKGDYRPDACSRTALELAWHIAAAEHRFFSAPAAGEFNLAPINRSDSVRNSADIAAWYAESFAKDIERLTTASGEQLARVLDFRGGEWLLM